MSICKWCGAEAVVSDGFGDQCAPCWMKQNGGKHGRKRKQTASGRQEKVSVGVRQDIRGKV